MGAEWSVLIVALVETACVKWRVRGVCVVVTPTLGQHISQFIARRVAFLGLTAPPEAESFFEMKEISEVARRDMLEHRPFRVSELRLPRSAASVPRRQKLSERPGAVAPWGRGRSARFRA